MIPSSFKWIGALILIVWTGLIWTSARGYQSNIDDLKTKNQIIKQQTVEISLLKADKELKAQVLVQVESFTLDLNDKLISKDRELNHAKAQIALYKKTIDSSNVITTGFMQLATGAYPYFAGMPFNSSSASTVGAADRIVPSDGAVYIRERIALGERYRIYFIACRDQYNYVMKKNNDFVMSMDK